MRRRWIPVLAGLAIAIVAVVYWRHRGSSQAAAPTAGTPTSRPTGALQRDRTRGDDSIPLPVFADDDPPGELRLEGQVLDSGDHPVGGATVGLGSNPPRTTTTEADGSFVFDKLVGRSYRLVARAPSGVAGPVTARLTAKSQPIVLHLRGGARLAVAVVGTDGKPVETASVELRGNDFQSATTVHGNASFVPVVPGNYEVIAWADGMARTTQQMRVMGDAKIRLMLASGAPVSGRVVDEGGAGIANARVVYIGSSGFRGGGGDPQRDSVVTLKDGTFKFTALASGSVRFLARHDEHASGMSALVTLDGKTERTGVMVTLPAGAEVRGRVVDTNNQPVAGARVEISSAWRGRGRRGGGAGGDVAPPAVPQPPRQSYTDESGEFAIKGLPRGELIAMASHELGSATAVQVDASSGSATNVVLRLDLTATIAGTVVDDSNVAVEGAQVSASPRMDGGNFDPAQFRNRRDNSAVTDADGHFKITGLAQGPFSVRASRSVQQGFGGFGRRRRGGSDGVDATAGDQNVHIVLPAEGGVKGKVTMTDGTIPVAFTVTAGTAEQSFTGSSQFELDAVAPGSFELDVRGPGFDSKALEIVIEPGKITDVGTISVAQGRQLAGIVVSNGQPVANATVYAGAQVMGGGSTNDTPSATMFGTSTKTDTTAPDGTFSLAGFGGGDLTIVADLAGVGRSTPMRVTEDAQNPTNLTLQLQPYGSISGTLQQATTSAGVGVTAQSTSTPGAVYVVQAGADGMYSFDQLAPDTYKVSATLGSPRRGMHFYSKQVVLPPSTNVTCDLSVDTGSVTVVVTPTSANGGTVGVAIGWLASATLTATTDQALSLQLAAAGAGNSQMAIARSGPATFTDVASGPYTVCLVALPSQVQGMQAVGYLQRHASALPAVCQPVVVADSPTTQAVTVQVTVPPMIPDPLIPPPGPSP